MEFKFLSITAIKPLLMIDEVLYGNETLRVLELSNLKVVPSWLS